MKKPENEGKVTIVGGCTTSAQARGRMAEDIAAAHLTRHGLRILARNVRCRGGEVDLIALERGTVTFIEVRLRKDQRFGGAAASITTTKQARVIHAARWWLAGNGRQYADSPCRFDAVVFDTIDASQPDWIRGAFDAS